jgi:TonB family protein
MTDVSMRGREADCAPAAFKAFVLALSLSLSAHALIVFPELVLKVSSGKKSGTPAVRPVVSSMGSGQLQVRLANDGVLQRGIGDSVPSIKSAAAESDVPLEARTAASKTVPGTSESPLPDLPLGTRYYRLSELDERPRPKSQIEPEFPLTVDPGVVGAVVARLFLSTEGTVEDIQIEASTPTGLFDDAVLKAFRDASYSPGKKKGIAVRSQIRIEIEFRSTPLK